MKKSIKVTMSGLVQGISFRQFCKENADKFGLKGFVRNLENGNVEVVAEGDHEALEKLTQVLKQGPKHSEVKNINLEEKPWQGQFKEFKVLRF